jgi:hypothetical protein
MKSKCSCCSLTYSVVAITYFKRQTSNFFVRFFSFFEEKRQRERKVIFTGTLLIMFKLTSKHSIRYRIDKGQGSQEDIDNRYLHFLLLNQFLNGSYTTQNLNSMSPPR